MASAALSQHSDDAVPSRSRAQVDKPGHLPVSEVAFDRSGAASPFGDDLRFPMPVDRLTYVHPVEGAPPAHL
jgi:succinate dehydrogenase / fumarate reductase iron-sulfur subunit